MKKKVLFIDRDGTLAVSYTHLVSNKYFTFVAVNKRNMKYTATPVSYTHLWSASHNIGEALTFLIVASIVSVLGWRYGFFGAGIVGLLGALIVWKFFHDTPESQGFPPVNAPKQKEEMSVVETIDFNKRCV